MVRDALHAVLPFAIAATALKVLLFPAYHSTDFEVHRNWLALTHSLPVDKWYFEHTSEWTLDYPPFFAYFEWVLSQLARLVDSAMLDVKNLNYSSTSTVIFQRSTVIATELLLLSALLLFVSNGSEAGFSRRAVVALSIFLSPGLLIIDHIHFQYNGFMYGILIFSLALARSEKSRLLSGVTFAALLCFKHIYLYLAPAYFVFLLRTYCLGSRSIFEIRWVHGVKLGASILFTFGLAFGPFAYWRQMPQLLDRMFPFARGLNHAYWAPNFWAIYSLADRVLLSLAQQLRLTVNQSAVNSLTRGLVGDTTFAVLPAISPRTCFLLTLCSQLVCLIKLFLKPSWEIFVGAVTLCGYASFLFGWHVHEKAILLILLPFSLIASDNRRYLGAFRPLAVAGHVSLFPLIFTAPEFPIKCVYTLVWLVIFLLALDYTTPTSSSRLFLLDRSVFLYNIGFIPLIFYCSVVHPVAVGAQLEFVPLLLISTYSAIGVMGSWLGFIVVYFSS